MKSFCVKKLRSLLMMGGVFMCIVFIAGCESEDS